MRRKVTLLAAIGVLSVTALPGPAHAQEGLTADPQSPAGVEYAVPLDDARGHGDRSGGSNSGSGSGDQGGSGSPALFGNGIEPASGKDGSGGGKDTKGGPAGGKPQIVTPGNDDGAVRKTVASVPSSASYSTTGPVTGLIAAILAVGFGLGLFLRLRARRSGPGSS